MNLTVTKERVLEAANNCPTAKATLKTLFPEVFKPVYPLQVGDIYKHPTGKLCTMVLLRTTWNQDSYILVGSVYELVFSNDIHNAGPQSLDKIEEYLTKNNMVFSHNIQTEIRKLID